jgi:hypothetical protein
VWVRVEGEEWLITAKLEAGLVEVQHRLSSLGNPHIDLSHYPGHPR